MELPETYVLSKIRLYMSFIKEGKKYINGCCPVCREGNSWGHKRRLFYFKDEKYFYCHNCNSSWSPFFWIKEVSGMSFKEIKEELKDYDCDLDFSYKLVLDDLKESDFQIPSLPGECVNLRDHLQLKYFSNYPIVNIALDYCQNRRLFTAINAPKTFYVCLNDKFHGNRLIIPYLDFKGKVVHYISRKLMNSDTRAKYLVKFGSSKPIFNIENIDEDFPYIFIFEGQIDSMFVKNGIAISGIHLTTEQDAELMSKFPFHQRIWVLDNFEFEDDEVKKIIIDKIKSGERIFFYKDDFSKFKDLNDYCVEKKQDQIDPALILSNSFSDAKALINL